MSFSYCSAEQGRGIMTTDQDREGQTFLISGHQVTISQADVLAGTFRKQPTEDDTRSASHWVLMRRNRVPTKWALRRTLAYLAREGRENAVALQGKALDTRLADRVMAALGFPIEQDPNPDHPRRRQ